ncbi:MAG: septal ring lytic transglycosylase RlpA family protein [Spirochaetes bacterium]|nr:septal ring lytic transglycosylase RlpA family protein [Spirochaetota bacterium]
MKRIIFYFYFFLLSISTFSNEQEGLASWYGPNFHGKKTANGEIFNTNDFTAAHRTYPFNSIVKVISLENNNSTIVRINDRGPFANDRIIDLSQAAAGELDMIKNGVMKVRIILMERGDNKYHKFSNKKYKIQLASFSDKKKAENLIENLKDNVNNINIEKIHLDKTFYRVFIDDLNYSELQILRVKLNRLNITNFMIIKKK